MKGKKKESRFKSWRKKMDEHFYGMDDELLDEAYYEGEESEDVEYYENEKLTEDEITQEDGPVDIWENRERQGLGEKVSSIISSVKHSNLKHAVKSLSPVQWLACTMAMVVLITTVATTVVYANHLDFRKAQETAAMAQAQAAAEEAARKAAEEASKLPEEEELVADVEEVSAETYLSLVLTSVQKDLKIKVVDQDEMLVKDVEWKVGVTDSKDKEKEYIDDDKDGIIYITEMAGGDYSVVLKDMPELSAQFIWPEGNHTVAVKDKVEYKVINDIKEEIKKESDVNVSVEDTSQKVKEPDSGATLTDTVEFVESTKTLLSGEESPYTKIDKSEVDLAKIPYIALADPVIRSDVMQKMCMTGIAPLKLMSMLTSNKAVRTVTGNATEFTVTFKADGNILKEERVLQGNDATAPAHPAKDGYEPDGWDRGFTNVQENLEVNAKYKETPKVQFTITFKDFDDRVISTATVNKGENATPPANPTRTGYTFSRWNGSYENVQANADVTAEYTQNAETTTITGLTNQSIAVGASVTLNVTTNATGDVNWTSGTNGIVELKGNGRSATVKGLAAGTTLITATAGGKSTSCTITVTAANSGVTLEVSGTNTVVVGKTTQLTAKLTGSTEKVAWASNNTAVATVNASGLVTGVKVGEATITASAAGKQATVKITVTEGKRDRAAKLKDKSGNVLFIKTAEKTDSAAAVYKEATFGDYEDNKDLFKKANSTAQYKYTGWQTLDGQTYYFKADGTKVTGEQVIGGVKYNFGSDGALSKGSGTFGIDVSKWNGNINWNAVKASGVSYAIIRCGYRGSSTGALIEDPKFRANIAGAKAAGLKVGVYFFTQAINEVEAVEEASMVAALCAGYGINYPVFFDVESGPRADGISAAQRTAVVKAFCETIKSKGYTPGVYANKTWLTSYMDTSQFGGYKIWLAQYNANGPTYKGRYDLWQYTSKGSVNGISGNVDLNQSYLGY